MFYSETTHFQSFFLRSKLLIVNNVPYSIGKSKHEYTYLENTLKKQVIKESLLSAVPSSTSSKMGCLRASVSGKRPVNS